MPKPKHSNKQKAQSATASAPLPAAKAAPEPITISIDTLRQSAATAEAFAVWASNADDDDAPALLFYPKPAGMGKGVWSWQRKARYDADMATMALKAAEAALKAAEAALPKPMAVETPSCSDEEEDGPRYVCVPESAEAMAARQARYAADGRDKNGTLLMTPGAPCAPACSCFSCRWTESKSAVVRWSDAECQDAVDLWGARLGAELIMMQNEDYSFDDIYGSEMQQAWDDWCAAHNFNAAEIEAADKAAIAANWQRAVVEQAMVEARRNLKKNDRVKKNGRVCTRCYSCVGTKHTNWEDGGHRARPSTLHVSDICFTHQAFLDGEIREDCPFLHSGDKGWHTEWDSNILWDPSTGIAPVPRHVRSREGEALVCISESSSGQLPLHLGGKPVAAVAGPAFAQRAAPQGRCFAALAPEATQQQQKSGARRPATPSAAIGGGGSSASQNAWGRK